MSIERMTASISCVELADLVGIDVRWVRQLAKIKDDSLRPPGYMVGRQYRIWVSELDDYLHANGKYADGGFAKAMEVLHA